jgi:cyclophilin family peptidyl-prolyl cis-trans isomerase/chitodextrinase
MLSLVCVFGGLLATMGANGGSCIPAAVLPNLLRPPPAIIPSTPSGDSLDRTFTVDLRDYPETDRLAWEFGDGARATNLSVARGQLVTHAYQAGGTYRVAVHLFSAANIETGRAERLATGTLPVEVTAPNKLPTAAFDVSDLLDDQGRPLPLGKRLSAARSSDPDGTIQSYEWDLGDGGHETGKTVDHTFALAGTFVVRLTVVDDRGGSAGTTRTILANTRPTASFTFTQDAGDAMTYTFDASASTDPEGAIVSYRWDFGDLSAQTTGVVVTHTYAVPDNYTVTLTVADEVGAVATASKVLDVTGTEPFVRSITPNQGQVGATLTGVAIDGENFESGATVQLRHGADVINGTAVTVPDAKTIKVTLDLTGAATGAYTIVVTNPGGASVQLLDGFTVVTPNLVRLTTSKGDILLQLVDDAPITTANFLQYVQDHFYDGTIFHRVVPDFVVQGGGFLPGMVEQTGVRGPIQNEFSATRSNVRGTVAMAKLGNDPNSATSQFFVNLADNSANLDNQNGGFTVFANVIEGMDVVDAIAAVPLNSEQPVTDVLLITARRE